MFLIAILLNLLGSIAVASDDCKQVVSVYHYTLAEGVVFLAGESNKKMEIFDNEFFCVTGDTFTASYMKNGETLKKFTTPIEAGNHYVYEGSMPDHPDDEYLVKIQQPTQENLIFRFGDDWKAQTLTPTESKCVKLTARITCSANTNSSLIVGDEVVEQGDNVELCIKPLKSIIPVEVATQNNAWYADEGDEWIRNYGTYLSKGNNWEWNASRNYCTVDISQTNQ